MENNKIKEFKDALETEVLIKVVSSRGHDEYTEPLSNVVARVQDECDNNGKWAYINGVQVNPSGLSIDDFIDAEDVTLTNALVGG